MAQQTEDREPADNYREALLRGVPYRAEDGKLRYPTMSSRPKPDFTLDPLHRFLLVGSLVVAIGYTVWMVARIPSMPDEVPMHFAPDGSVNRYGSPWEMLILVVLVLGTIIGVAILSRYPRVYNYSTSQVTEDNIQAHYKNGVQLMTWMVFSCTVLYFVMLGSIAGDWPMNPGIWIAMAILFGSGAFFLLRMQKI